METKKFYFLVAIGLVIIVTAYMYKGIYCGRTHLCEGFHDSSKQGTMKEPKANHFLDSTDEQRTKQMANRGMHDHPVTNHLQMPVGPIEPDGNGRRVNMFHSYV
jgi:hypothetical protein